MELFLEVKESTHAGLIEANVPQHSRDNNWSIFFDLNKYSITEGSTIIEIFGGVIFTLGVTSFSR